MFEHKWIIAQVDKTSAVFGPEWKVYLKNGRANNDGNNTSDPDEFSLTGGGLFHLEKRGHTVTG